MGDSEWLDIGDAPGEVDVRGYLITTFPRGFTLRFPYIPLNYCLEHEFPTLSLEQYLLLLIHITPLTQTPSPRTNTSLYILLSTFYPLHHYHFQQPAVQSSLSSFLLKFSIRLPKRTPNVGTMTVSITLPFNLEFYSRLGTAVTTKTKKDKVY